MIYCTRIRTDSDFILCRSVSFLQVNACKDAFRQCFPLCTITADGVAAPSNVPDQPMGEDETRQGAINRAKNAEGLYAGSADFFVGLEGGLAEDPCSTTHGVGQDSLACMAWMAIYQGTPYSITIPHLPPLSHFHLP